MKVHAFIENSLIFIDILLNNLIEDISKVKRL